MSHQVHERLDWRDDNVVVQQQSAVAVYSIDPGLVVMQQEAEVYSEEDLFIFLTPENATRVAKALLAEVDRLASCAREAAA